MELSETSSPKEWLTDRFNRILLTMIRKTIQFRDLDWQQDLDRLLFYCLTRPHATIGMPSMMVMCALELGGLLVAQSCYGWCPRRLGLAYARSCTLNL